MSNFNYRPLDEIWSTRVTSENVHYKKQENSQQWSPLAIKKQVKQNEEITHALDMMMKEQEDDLVQSLNLNLDEPSTAKNTQKKGSIYDSLFDLNFDKKSSNVLEIPEKKNSFNFNIFQKKDETTPTTQNKSPKRERTRSMVNTHQEEQEQEQEEEEESEGGESEEEEQEQEEEETYHQKNPRQEIKKFSSTVHGKETCQIRTTYLTWCEKLNVTPSTELLKSLKISLRNQTQFGRLSICHAVIDKKHVKAIVKTLESNPCINEILLNHDKICDDGAIIIANSLKTNKSITSVELFGNEIGDESQQEFAEMLKVNKNLKRLKLGDNNIGPKGAAFLSKGIKKNTSLTQLHLGGNKIQVEGLEHIADALKGNTTLTSLGLRDNDVGPNGMKALSSTLKDANCALSDIQLKGNKISAQGASFLAHAIEVNKSLKVLELQSNSIGPSGVKLLCDALKLNKSVHALNFNENELGDEGAAHVSNLLIHNPSITTLGLANNRIRKKGAQHLGEALKSSKSAVTGLDLGNNELGNGGAVSLANALKENNVLTSLDLRSCEIHLKGILSLADMSSVNKTLRHLDLGANYAKNQGAISWSQVLSRNTTLTRLCLTDNQIYNEGGEALARSMQKNYTLRNFSYGGQGPSANRIDSTIRRVIDSIVSENKRTWEASNGKSNRSVSVFTPKLSPRLIKGSRKIDISNIRFNRSKSGSLINKKNGKYSYGLPNWFTAYEKNPKSNDPQLEYQLSYLFQKNLLKAENPKFPGCYFIGHIANTLSKIFPESNVDEIQLVYFAYNNPDYYVHLSPEMVKTQIKYVGNNQQSNRNTVLRPRRKNSIKNSNSTKKVFHKALSHSPENKPQEQNINNVNTSINNNNNNTNKSSSDWMKSKSSTEECSTYDFNGFPTLKYKAPKTFMKSKYFGAIGDERSSFTTHLKKKANDIDFTSLEESLKSIKF